MSDPLIAQDASRVVAVCSSPKHGFSKQPQAAIRLLAGLGVEGDAHCGTTVQHVYLKRRNPLAPNRMQVHLMAAELFAELADAGYDIAPGQLGENITTSGVDLVHLPLGTQLHLGDDAVVELTGLRSPCVQMEKFRPGLLKQVVQRGDAQRAAARAGVMAIVLQSGVVARDADVRIALPSLPHIALAMI